MGADLKKRAPKGATVLVGAFSVEDAYCNQGACGQRSEAAAYLLDFLLIQVTSALTNQYSVLVVHACSPFAIGSVERAQARQEGLFGDVGQGCRLGSVNCIRGDLRQLRRLRSRCIWSPF